jgi:hypothetical protein
MQVSFYWQLVWGPLEWRFWQALHNDLAFAFSDATSSSSIRTIPTPSERLLGFCLAYAVPLLLLTIQGLGVQARTSRPRLEHHTREEEPLVQTSTSQEQQSRRANVTSGRADGTSGRTPTQTIMEYQSAIRVHPVFVKVS